MTDKQHLQELAAYRFTVENREARIAELEAQLAALQQAAHTKGVFVDAGALQMVLNALERDALEGKQVRAEMRLALMQSVAATKPAAQGVDDGEVPEAVLDAVAAALGDAYDCTRVWSAWGCGTMSSDDFSLVAEDGERVAEIARAAIAAKQTP